MKKKWKIITGILTILFCMLIGCEKKNGKEELLLVSLQEAGRNLTETPGADSIQDTEADSAQHKEEGLAGEQETDHVPDKEVVKEAEMLVIHICGAVDKPGIYLLEPGSRLYQAVEAAGGFAECAGEEYLNLADTLSDGEKIYIPTIQEAEEENLPKHTRESGVTETVNASRVNINTASAELLCTLPGIGEGKAENIIAYREDRGRFQAIEDIMKVDGIKAGLFQKIKDKIEV